MMNLGDYELNELSAFRFALSAVIDALTRDEAVRSLNPCFTKNGEQMLLQCIRELDVYATSHHWELVNNLYERR